jgi:hypothetical protein
MDLPRNIEEVNFAITYLRQLHFLHGFERIFVPKVVLGTISEFTQVDGEKYLEKLGQLDDSEDKLVREFENEFTSILWQMKRTDIYEAQLSSLLSLYAIWLQAKRLRSLIVQSLSTPTDSFFRLIHLLAGEQREFIGRLADDIELWLFSHFADLYVEWPYFLSFTKEMVEIFQKDDYYKKSQEQFIDFRTRTCVYPANKFEFRKRAKMISQMLAHFNWIIRSATEKFSKEIIISRASLAVSNVTLITTKKKTLNYSMLAEFREVQLTNRVLVPCFLHIKFYPSELLKSVRPYGLLPEGTNPLVYYSLFENAQEAELKLVLSKLRKRLKISDTF